MPDIAALIQSGATNLWLFVPTAILLGALHGLEPGHSKTMMAAFIIAIRGTVMQAVLLGLAATVSHTAIVWAIALAGLHFGSAWSTETTEPYLQLVSAVAIIGIAVWMLWRTWRDQNGAHDHHHHGEGPRTVDLGHGTKLALDIFEDGVPPRWRIERLSGSPFAADTLSVETLRPDGQRQTFTFVAADNLYESVEEIPEPHEFQATLRLGHNDHAHSAVLDFHGHDHHHHDQSGLDVGLNADADAHERAHAEDIRRRFANQSVTTGQIVMFGLTGGLIPCPASITILLLCLQLKQFTLGATLVLCFSIGLALTIVTVGAAAAMSAHHVATRWSGFDVVAKRAPYLSGALIILVGLYTGYLGWVGLATHHA
ncbi:MAG: nickel/cobalt efflux transporter RcnA [Proteobacteria bacterium]|nr:nickel/cobalt efflux transporter RcnA [Pseudomonadota bacterium]